jgi:uridine phosphorylase
MREPNTLLSKGEVKKEVLLVGGEEPRLVKKILKNIAELTLIRKNKGFHTFNCITTSNKIQFTLCITGVGPSCTEIAFNELAKCGGKIFIRAGTSGALVNDLNCESVIITENAIRLEGVSDLYVDKNFDASADETIINALREAAIKLNLEYKIGTTLTSSSFYALGGKYVRGEIEFDGYSAKHQFKPKGFEILKKVLQKKNALNIEMETATLLVLSKLNGLKSGSVCGISNYIPWKEGEQIKYTEKALKNAIRVATRAIELIDPMI